MSNSLTNVNERKFYIFHYLIALRSAMISPFRQVSALNKRLRKKIEFRALSISDGSKTVKKEKKLFS